MFIDTGGGWHLNLAHVARIHVVDHGGSGASIKFYAPGGQTLGECNPGSPEALAEVLRMIREFGGGASGVEVGTQ